jgi:uncharacterized protein YecE (DUF72 family)
MATLFVGTSGFRYPAWKPGFYPARLPAHQFLKHYAERLNCVEINYTFRKLEVPEVITADFVYYRLRKPEYSEEDVDALAVRARELLAAGRDLYLMFKHEETPAGALNAELVLKKAGDSNC